MIDHSFDRQPGAPGERPDPISAAARAVAMDRRHDRPEPAGDTEVHLLKYVKVFYKRRRMAFTAFLLVVGGVTVYTFTTTPMFEARTRLLIEAENQNVVSFKAVLDEDQTRADYYQTQYNLLQSRALALRTIEELKLWDTPPFGGTNDGRFSVKSIVRSVPVALGLVTAQTPEAAGPALTANDAPGGPAETVSQSRAIEAFAAALTVAPVRNSRLVDVKFDLPDGALAASVVNALAKNYITQNLEYKFMASKDASDWLGQQLGEQRKQVEDAEKKLQQYREQNDSISMKDSENIVVQKLSDLNGAVTLAKTERFQKEAIYRQVESLRGTPAALDTFPAILANTFIQQQKTELTQLQSQSAQLGENLGPNHPEMVKLRSALRLTQAKLDGEIGKVVQGVKNEYLASLAKENSLTAALNAQKGDALAMNRKAIDYSVLDREVQSSRQIFDSLMQRAKETGVSAELKTSNIRVVDRAQTPMKPVSPRKGLNLLLAVFGGSLLACGLVLFLEHIDSRIKTPDEVTLHLQLPHLGLLPALNAKQFDNVYPLISGNAPPNFGEAFRDLRTNVLFSSADGGSRSIVVTSTGPGEGKSLVAANLAISLAQATQRVLLLDADLRKPQVHDIFQVSQQPGLSNLLVGDAKASESVRKTDTPGLWVLTSGRIPPNPAELLGSQRFKELLVSVKEHFDWVIVDSPPVMAVTDARLVAQQATGVLFVVGAEMTSWHAAKRALDHLEYVQARFVGAVLNRVDLQRNAYYYSDYYRREYVAYYGGAQA
jgi:succinoglycan biosynthesis transport protein ExoP